MDRVPLPPLAARHWWALGAICLVGALTRFVALGTVPPGLWFDEGLNGLNALQILGGETPMYFARHGLPQEPLHMYALAAMVWLMGPTALALRATSAVIGTLTLPVAFGCYREIFRSNRLALLGTAAMAVMHWHVHFSRQGLRTIWVPLIALAVFWLVLATLRRPRVWTGALAGLVLAVGMHTYLTVRLIPLVLLALLGWEFVNQPLRPGLGKALAAALVVFLLGVAPLATHLLTHTDHLQGRVSDISMFSGENPEGWTSLGQGTRGVVGIAENALVNTWVFGLRGDHVAKHGLPGVPVFDPVTALAMLLGVVIAVRRWSVRRGMALLLLWLGGLLLASVLSFGAPNLLRTLGVAPAAMGLAVLGVDWMAGHVGERWGKRAGMAVLFGWLAWFATVETIRFHGEWAGRPDVWQEFSGAEHAVGQAIQDLPEGVAIAAFDGWQGHDTFVFLTQGRYVIDVPSEDLPLPMDRPLHLFLLIGLESQRAFAESVRANVPPSHELEEHVFLTPDGTPHALEMILTPRGVTR